MPRIRYKVTLEEPERPERDHNPWSTSSQKVLNALILLKCDEGRFQDRKFTNPVSLKKIDRQALGWNKASRRWTAAARTAPGKRRLRTANWSHGQLCWSLRLLADRMDNWNT